MSWTGEPTGAFQVALPGEYGPAFLATFAEMGADHVATTSVFLLPVAEDQGIHDVTAMLQQRGLVIVGIRRIADPSTDHPSGMRPGETA